MGYEDRDYMRGAPAGQRSNPLWWLLGLIAAVLIVAALRRGAPPHEGTPGDLAASVGPVKIGEMDFAVGGERSGELLPLLQTFFRQHGYDSTIHESADGSRSTAIFARQGQDGKIVQSVSYQRINAAKESLPVTHQLQCQLLRIDPVDASGAVEETVLLLDQLRLRLEQELPGIVTRFDNDPQAMTDDDWM